MEVKEAKLLLDLTRTRRPNAFRFVYPDGREEVSDFVYSLNGYGIFYFGKDSKNIIIDKGGVIKTLYGVSGLEDDRYYIYDSNQNVAYAVNGIEVKILDPKGFSVDERKIYETPSWLVKKMLEKAQGPFTHIIDPTAGSGAAFEEVIGKLPAFEKTKLTGLEIREMTPPQKWNKVHYGHSVMPLIRAVLASYKLPSREDYLYFLNPPYTNDGLLEKLTIRALTTLDYKSLIVGVFSKKVLSYLQDFKGLAVVAPAPPEWADKVEKIVLFCGTAPEGFRALDIKEAATLEEGLELIAEAVKHRTEITKWARKASAEKASNCIKRIKELHDKGLELLKKDQEFVPQAFQAFLNQFSVKRRIIANEKIFPDPRIFNSPVRRSYKEIKDDANLLNFYQMTVPQVYSLIKETADLLGNPLPKVEQKEKEYSTSKELGLVKYKYYPRKFAAEGEILKVALSYLNPTDRKAVEEYLNNTEVPHFFVVKSSLAATGGEDTLSVLGYATGLALVDDTGRDIALFNIPLEKFFADLEEKGLIDLSDRVEVITPTKEEKEKVLKGWLGLFERHSLLLPEDKAESYLKEYDSLDRQSLSQFLVRAAKELGIYESFPNLLQDENWEDELVKTVVAYLKESGINPPSKAELNKALTKVFEAIKKAPYRALYAYEGKLKSRLAEIFSDLVEVGDANKENLVKDLADRFVDTAKGLFSFVNAKRIGVIKLTEAVILNAKIKKELENGRIDQAFRHFENIMLKTFGLRPHQYKEALGITLKYLREGEVSHILGWEMRAGKTLTMAATALFFHAVSGKKVLFSPKTANVPDIIYQMTEYLPISIYLAEGVRSGDTEPPFAEEKTKTYFSDLLIPNIYAFFNKGTAKKAIPAGGQFIDKESGLYLEKMRALLEKDNLPEIPEGGPLSFLRSLPLNEKVKRALAVYLQRLADNGDLLLEGEGFADFARKLTKWAREFDDKLKKDMAKGDAPIKVVPKSIAFSFDYEVENPETIKFKIDMDKNKKIQVEIINERDVGYEAINNSGSGIILSGLSTYVDIEKIEGCRFAVENDFLNKIEDLTIAVGKNLGNYLLLKDENEAKSVIEQVEEYLEENGDKLLSSEKSNLKRVIEKLKKMLEDEGERKDELAEVFVNLASIFDSVKVSIRSIFNHDKELFGRVYFGKRVLTDELKEAVKELEGGVECEAKVEFRKNGAIKKISLKTVDRRLPIRKERSASNARNYFYLKEALDDFGGVIIDEVDEAVDPYKAKSYRAFLSLNRNAVLKVGGTGTPTAGYPEDVVALSGLISGQPIGSIITTMNIVSKNYSVWEFPENAKGVAGEVIYTAILKGKGHWVVNFLNSCTPVYSASEAVSVLQSLLEIAGDNLTLASSLQKEIEELENGRSTSAVYEELIDLASKLKAEIRKNPKISEEQLLNLFYEIAKSGGNLKKTPGTLDPVGLVSSLSGASFSFKTREQLKSESLGRPVKEELSLDDHNLEKMKKFYRQQVGAPPFAEDSEKARETVDLYSLPKITVNMTVELDYKTAFDLVKGDLSALQDAIIKNPKPLADALSEKPNDIKRAVSPSTRDGSGSLSDAFIYAFKTGDESLKNYPLPEADKDKKELLAKVLNLFAQGMLHNLYADNLPLQKEIDIPERAFLAQKIWADCGVHTLTVPLFRKKWRAFLKENFNSEPFEFTYNPLLVEKTPVDIFSNSAYQRETEKRVKEGFNLLLTSPRVSGLITALSDALAAALEKEHDKETVFLIRAAAPELKTFVSQLDIRKLAERNITVKVFNDTSALDVESKRLKKRAQRGQIQLIVAATDKAIARGVDLSHLHEIISYGITVNGRTAQQLFARLFNAGNKNKGYVFTYGLPVAYKKVFSNVILFPARDFFSGLKLSKKLEFGRAVLKGEVSIGILKEKLGTITPATELESTFKRIKEQITGKSLGKDKTSKSLEMA